MKCLMISSTSPWKTKYLADIGNYSNSGPNPNPKSQFAMNYCDAMVVTCNQGDYFSYALGTTNFSELGALKNASEHSAPGSE